MKKINEYRFIMFRNGEVDYKEKSHSVVTENEKTLVYEDESKCFDVIHLNNKSFFFGIKTSLDNPTVSEGSYYPSNSSPYERKQGIAVYLHTFKAKDEALDVIKNAIIEKYSWIDKLSIDNAIKKINP